MQNIDFFLYFNIFVGSNNMEWNFFRIHQSVRFHGFFRQKIRNFSREMKVVKRQKLKKSCVFTDFFEPKKFGILNIEKFYSRTTTFKSPAKSTRTPRQPRLFWTRRRVSTRLSPTRRGPKRGRIRRDHGTQPDRLVLSDRACRSRRRQQWLRLGDRNTCHRDQLDQAK